MIADRGLAARRIEGPPYDDGPWRSGGAASSSGALAIGSPGVRRARMPHTRT
jgi:hypothetical protein